MTTALTALLVVLGFASVSMAVFALGTSRRARPPGTSGDRAFLLGSFLRDWFYWVLSPVLRLALALGATPVFFNFIGLALGLAAGAAFATGRLPLGGWCVLLGGIADSLDGRVARVRGMDHPYGAFLDSVLDRFSELAVFIGLAAHFSHDPIAAPLILTAAGGSLAVSYTRARGEGLGVSCTGGIMQRAERLLLLGLAPIADPAVSAWAGTGEAGALVLPILGLIALGTLGTAVYRTVWIVRRLREEPHPSAEEKDAVETG